MIPKQTTATHYVKERNAMFIVVCKLGLIKKTGVDTVCFTQDTSDISTSRERRLFERADELDNLSSPHSLFIY